MTDHPSNPPSQGEKIVSKWLGADGPTSMAALIDSALAAQEAKLQRAQKGNLDLAEKLDAQEARHKAAIEGMALALLKATKEGEQSSADARVADAQWKGWMAKAEEAESRLRVSHVQNAVLQREVGLLEETISEQASKLREAGERERRAYDTIVHIHQMDGCPEITRRILDALAAIRSGPDQQAAPRKRNVLHPDGTCCCEEHGCFANAPMGCDCDSPADPPEQETPKRQGCPARSWVQAHVIPPHVQPPTCTECGRVFL